MTKEQEKVIERLEKDKNKTLECGDMTVVFVDDLETVLNLIQEQQAEIEGLKIANNEAWEEWNNLEQGAFETEKKLKEEIKTYKNTIDKALIILEEKERYTAEIEKKNKIIAKMAKFIEGLDIEQDICLKVTGENGCDNINRDVECKECIIQYFERRVEK